MSEDIRYPSGEVRFIDAFYHPRLGLLLWHIDEDNEAFVLAYPQMHDEISIKQTVAMYARAVKVFPPPAELG